MMIESIPFTLHNTLYEPLDFFLPQRQTNWDVQTNQETRREGTACNAIVKNK